MSKVRAQDVLEIIALKLGTYRRIEQSYNISEWYGYCNDVGENIRIKFINIENKKSKYLVYKRLLTQEQNKLYVAFKYIDKIYLHLVQYSDFDHTKESKITFLESDINKTNTSFEYEEEKYLKLRVMNETISSIQSRAKEMVDIKALESLLMQKHQCAYCGLTQEQNNKLWTDDKGLTKRSRGHKMEVDRIRPNDGYVEGNILLSCYWCNNAKTDTFSLPDFKEIARGINAAWQTRLSEIVHFPEQTYEE